MRDRLIQAILTHKLVVIVRNVERELLIPFAEAVYKGGVRLLEITFSADGRVSDQQTADNIRMLREHFGDRMDIGAGTVLTQEQAALTAAAGGGFVISPDTCPAVIQKTRELGLVSLPGALTPSEIRQAHDAGADFVKVFPAVSMGPEYLKAVRAPLSHIRLLAVGGIDLQNIPAYLDAGVSGFGLGSNIVDKKLLAAGDFAGITRLAQRYAEAVNAL